MVAFLYSKFSIWFALVAAVLALGYYLCIEPKESLLAQNIKLVSVNTGLESLVTNTEARLLICSLKRKSETFESEMKGEGNEINAINDINVTVIDRLVF